VADPSLFIYYPFDEILSSDIPVPGKIIPIKESRIHGGFIRNHKGSVVREFRLYNEDSVTTGLIFNHGVAGSAFDLENKKVTEGVTHHVFQDLQSEPIPVLVSLYISLHYRQNLLLPPFNIRYITSYSPSFFSIHFLLFITPNYLFPYKIRYPMDCQRQLQKNLLSLSNFVPFKFQVM
jgi:hypothetical protein